MDTLKKSFASLFNRLNNAGAARHLLERAAQSRGLSRGDAASLRGNALALLRVVR